MYYWKVKFIDVDRQFKYAAFTELSVAYDFVMKQSLQDYVVKISRHWKTPLILHPEKKD
jgi:hypothetical protein